MFVFYKIGHNCLSRHRVGFHPGVGGVGLDFELKPEGPSLNSSWIKLVDYFARNMAERIFIVGAGAIGKVLAVFLARKGNEVVILRGSVDEFRQEIKKIEVVFADNTRAQAEIPVSSLNAYPYLDGIVLLTNKSYGNEALAEKLSGKMNNSPVVLLQNGLGVENPFIAKGFSELYRCVLFATCQTIGENKIAYKPVNVSPVGTIVANATRLESIVDRINNPDFPFRSEPEIQRIIWVKAIVNCVFNSICPLVETDNGIFRRDSKAFELAGEVIEECTAIAQAMGVQVELKTIEEQLLLISEKSDGQNISTFQDIENRRRTEIDTLNFEIVRMAIALGKESSVVRTKLLGDLVKMKSELSLAKT